MTQKPKRARSPSNASAFLLQTTVPKKLLAHVKRDAKQRRMSVSAWVRWLIESHESSFRGDSIEARLTKAEEKMAQLEAWHGARF